MSNHEGHEGDEGHEMKGIARYLTGSIVLTLAGALCLAAGTFDRRVAEAQREFAAQQYGRADATLERVERDLTYGRWVPSIDAALNDVRTRRTAIWYWSGQYDRIVSDRAASPGFSSGSIDLQLITANAVYRRSQPKANDKRAALDALQAAANAYLGVLKNSPRNEVAAYNYEYVVRTRQDIDKGRREADLTDNDKAEEGPAGRKGGPPPQPPKQDLKLLIPLEPGEIDKGLEPGKGSRLEHKG
jgi:hypothetical protein